MDVLNEERPNKIEELSTEIYKHLIETHSAFTKEHFNSFLLKEKEDLDRKQIAGSPRMAQILLTEFVRSNSAAVVNFAVAQLLREAEAFGIDPKKYYSEYKDFYVERFREAMDHYWGYLFDSKKVKP